ncbi:hypothetical protein BsWGS_03971 [Bradybaena similaris]
MSDQIGFSAAIVDIKTIEKNETVICPKVITNGCNGYDSKTGIFTAPKPGMYVFSIHATSQVGSMFKFRIYRKDVPCATAYANTPNARAMGGLQSVAFTLVPGHAGVSGNECADSLASCAPILGGSAMARADILNVIRGKGRTEDSRNDEESTSMFCFLELGVKCDAARFERHTGHMRHLINQHRAGTVSRLVLANMLKGI